MNLFSYDNFCKDQKQFNQLQTTVQTNDAAKDIQIASKKKHPGVKRGS